MTGKNLLGEFDKEGNDGGNDCRHDGDDQGCCHAPRSHSAGSTRCGTFGEWLLLEDRAEPGELRCCGLRGRRSERIGAEDLLLGFHLGFENRARLGGHTFQSVRSVLDD